MYRRVLYFWSSVAYCSQCIPNLLKMSIENYHVIMFCECNSYSYRIERYKICRTCAEEFGRQPAS